MDWQLHDRGFLPTPDPATRLTDPALADIDRLGADLPRLVHEQAFREKCADYLKTPIDWDTLAKTRGDAQIERLFLLFSYFASAYVHAPGMPPTDRLPAPLAVPLVHLARRVDRPPILSYASYCLHNWRRLDPEGPIALGNIALLQNFSLPGDGKADEDWFILVHVNIELCAGTALRAVRQVPKILDLQDPSAMKICLEVIAGSMQLMNKTLNRMPEGCSPDVYFRKVRPYIFGFTNIIYEGCFNNAPQNYRGETGAQSSIVPTMLMALGVRHKNSLLTHHLEDMQNYMPKQHRRFIREQASVRDFVIAHKNELRDPYNACITELIAFRSKHFEYAVNYIEKKVDNPIATGGTPYMPWLRQLIDETKEYLLS
jgi:indoleamine 2,3-dioxygenase